jgi:hypothetical protein
MRYVQLLHVVFQTFIDVMALENKYHYKAIPGFFFFVKRQVTLLKPNYLSGKNKQNFEVTQ